MGIHCANTLTICFHPENILHPLCLFVLVVYGEWLQSVGMETSKAKLYKTAKAVISCAKFKAGDYVAVRYFGLSPSGQHWFECATEKFPNPLPPLWHKSVCYPEKHLTDFCL